MKHLILLAVSLSLFANICLAQGNADSTKPKPKEKFFLEIKRHKFDSAKRFSIGFNDGYSIPVGEFGKTDETKYPISHLNGHDTNHLGGYGQYGFHYEYYAAYRFMKYLSAMVSIGGSYLSYDIGSLNSQFIQYFAPNTVTVTGGDSYYIIQYLAGPKLNLRLGKGFSFEFKALTGVTSANYPSFTYLGFPSIEIYTFPQSNGFGYNVGGGLKYITAEGFIGIHLNVSYAGSDITFPNYSVAFYTPISHNPALSNIYLGSSILDAPKTLDVSLFQVTLGFTAEL
jgi:hypothetical protein